MAVAHAEVLASGSPVPMLAPHDVFAELKTSPRGLTADDAAARQAEFGANRLPRARGRPLLAEFGSQFANMFAVVLMVAAVLTALTYLLSTPRDSATLVLAIGSPAITGSPRRRSPAGWASPGPASSGSSTGLTSTR
jgi:Cation transporter/ATPase, N-terminus